MTNLQTLESKISGSLALRVNEPSVNGWLINPKNCLKFLKKRSQFRCTGLLQTSTSKRQKFDLFYPKFSSEFNELSLKF